MGLWGKLERCRKSLCGFLVDIIGGRWGCGVRENLKVEVRRGVWGWGCLENFRGLCD